MVFGFPFYLTMDKKRKIKEFFYYTKRNERARSSSEAAQSLWLQSHRPREGWQPAGSHWLQRVICIPQLVGERLSEVFGSCKGKLVIKGYKGAALNISL